MLSEIEGAALILEEGQAMYMVLLFFLWCYFLSVFIFNKMAYSSPCI